MNVLKKNFILFGFIVFSFLFPKLNAEDPNTYVLRAPACGSHWFFYCSNYIFKKNIFTESTYLLKSYPYHKEGAKIVTAHNPFDLHLNPNSNEEDLLILLVRNYRECMLKIYENPENVKNEILYQASFNHLAQEKAWVLNLRMNHYFHNLRVYELWNPKKRMIVYYEDLLEHPHEVLSEVAKFLGENNKGNEIDAFVANLDEHVKNSLKIYEKTYVSKTRGKYKLYHTERIGIAKAKELDLLVSTYFPDFVEKYLSRYLLD